MKNPLNISLPKFLKFEWVLFFCLIFLPIVGVEIPKLISWIIINNAFLVLLINLENGKRTYTEFLQPKLLFYIVCILNIFILYKIL